MFTTSIAQQIANNTKRDVKAWKKGLYFSLNDAAHATSSNFKGEPDPVPTVLPLYLIPNGTPGSKPDPTLFFPH
jgi:hypothetical protein